MKQVENYFNKIAREFDLHYTGEKSVYDKLYDLLSKKINKLVNIDIVFLESAPMELQTHVAKYGRVLYQTSLHVFPDYRERVMRKYTDFAPLRKIFQKATLERIS